MRLRLVPRTTEFYDLFTAAGENAVEVARLAQQRFRECPDPSVPQSAVKELEHRGDDLTHEIIELLNTQYITPFDREDIFQLARAIDDVVDNIENASEFLGLYKIEAPMEQAVDQCRVLLGATEHLAGALSELKTLRRAERHLPEVKALEDEGDRIVRDALAALFEDGADPLDVIRWKDIFEALEEAIDACETAANVVGNIVVKNV
jgi:predicted phosphate transport protein (TIGR00153 family)